MTAVTDTQNPHLYTHTHTSRSPDFGWIDGWEGRGGAEIYNLLKRMRPSGILSKWPLSAPGLEESGEGVLVVFLLGWEVGSGGLKHGLSTL